MRGLQPLMRAGNAPHAFAQSPANHLVYSDVPVAVVTIRNRALCSAAVSSSNVPARLRSRWPV